MKCCAFRGLTFFCALLIALGGKWESLTAHDGLDSKRYLGWARTTTIFSRRNVGDENKIINPLRDGSTRDGAAAASAGWTTPTFLWPEVETRSAIYRLGQNELDLPLAKQSAASARIHAPAFEPRYSASALTKSPLAAKEAGDALKRSVPPIKNSAAIVIVGSNNKACFFARANQFTIQGGLWAGRLASELWSWLSSESRRVEKLLSVPAALDPIRYSPLLKNLSTSPWSFEKLPGLRDRKALSKPATHGYVISEFSRRPEGTALTSKDEGKFCFDGKCFTIRGGSAIKVSSSVPAFSASRAAGDSRKGEPVIAKSLVDRFLEGCDALFHSVARFLAPLLRISAAPPQVGDAMSIEVNGPSANDLSRIPAIAGYMQTGIWIR